MEFLRRTYLTHFFTYWAVSSEVWIEIDFDRKQKFERRWTIIALRNLIFYFWSNIELTWHECSFMPQMTNYKEKIMNFFFKPILGPFKIGLILSIWLYSKQQKLLIQNLFLKYFEWKLFRIDLNVLGKWGNLIFV